MTQEIEFMIDEVVIDIYNAYPELLERFGENGRKKCREDNQHHFHHLELAYTLNNPVVFLDYTKWLNSLLTSRGMKSEHIIDNFVRIQQVIQGKGLDGKEDYYQHCLTQAISLLKEQK
ncbi:hypothetical protein [Bacillus pinisoli]|uniref:hypothetical protein n=1 Tax=Bacillus pinisoli TaxID=2901866 RepID=UPI001FF1A27E|nr:hypothetical protein [Bacillus pinisoli]